MVYDVGPFSSFGIDTEENYATGISKPYRKFPTPMISVYGGEGGAATVL